MSRTIAENTAVVNEAIRVAAETVGVSRQQMGDYYSAGDFAAVPETTESLVADLVQCWNEHAD